MSIRIPSLSVLPSDLIFKRDLNLVDYRLFVLMSSFGNRRDKNLVWVSVSKFASLLGETRTRVYASLAKLQRLKLITDTGRSLRNGVRVWKILTPLIPSQPAHRAKETVSKFDTPSEHLKIDTDQTVNNENFSKSVKNRPVSKFDTRTENKKINSEKQQKRIVEEAQDPIDQTSSCDSGGCVSFENKNSQRPHITIPSSLHAFKQSVLKMIHGIPQAQAQELLDETHAQIQRHQENNDPIKNIGGYLSRLIQRWRQGLYTPGLAAKDRMKKEEAKKIEELKRIEDERLLEKKQVEDARNQQRLKIWQSLSPSKIAELKNQYITHLKRQNDFMLKHFRSSEFKSRGFEIALRGFYFDSLESEFS